MRRFAWLVGLVVLGACGPHGSAKAQMTLYTPEAYAVGPTIFHQLVYHEMEDCTGLKGDFSKVHWYIAPHGIMIVGPGYPAGQMARATWAKAPGGDRTIVISGEDFFNGEVISHESLHDLYGGDAPLDVAQRCILSWQRVLPIR